MTMEYKVISCCYLLLLYTHSSLQHGHGIHGSSSFSQSASSSYSSSGSSSFSSYGSGVEGLNEIAKGLLNNGGSFANAGASAGAHSGTLGGCATCGNNAGANSGASSGAGANGCLGGLCGSPVKGGNANKAGAASGASASGSGCLGGLCGSGIKGGTYGNNALAGAGSNANAGASGSGCLGGACGSGIKGGTYGNNALAGTGSNANAGTLGSGCSGSSCGTGSNVKYTGTFPGPSGSIYDSKPVIGSGGGYKPVSNGCSGLACGSLPGHASVSTGSFPDASGSIYDSKPIIGSGGYKPISNGCIGSSCGSLPGHVGVDAGAHGSTSVTAGTQSNTAYSHGTGSLVGVFPQGSIYDSKPAPASGSHKAPEEGLPAVTGTSANTYHFPGPQGSIHSSIPSSTAHSNAAATATAGATASAAANNHKSPSSFPQSKQTSSSLPAVTGTSSGTYNFPGPQGSIHSSKPASSVPMHPVQQNTGVPSSSVNYQPSYNAGTHGTTGSGSSLPPVTGGTYNLPGSQGSIHSSKPTGSGSSPCGLNNAGPGCNSGIYQQGNKPSYSSGSHGASGAQANTGSLPPVTGSTYNLPGPHGSIHSSKPAGSGSSSCGLNNAGPGCNSGIYQQGNKPSYSSGSHGASGAQANAGSLPPVTGGTYNLPGSHGSIHSSKPAGSGSSPCGLSNAGPGCSSGSSPQESKPSYNTGAYGSSGANANAAASAGAVSGGSGIHFSGPFLGTQGSIHDSTPVASGHTVPVGPSKTCAGGLNCNQPQVSNSDVCSPGTPGCTSTGQFIFGPIPTKPSGDCTTAGGCSSSDKKPGQSSYGPAPSGIPEGFPTAPGSEYTTGCKGGSCSLPSGPSYATTAGGHSDSSGSGYQGINIPSTELGAPGYGDSKECNGPNCNTGVSGAGCTGGNCNSGTPGTDGSFVYPGSGSTSSSGAGSQNGCNGGKCGSTGCTSSGCQTESGSGTYGHNAGVGSGSGSYGHNAGGGSGSGSYGNNAGGESGHTVIIEKPGDKKPISYGNGDFVFIDKDNSGEGGLGHFGHGSNANSGSYSGVKGGSHGGTFGNGQGLGHFGHNSKANAGANTGIKGNSYGGFANAFSGSFASSSANANAGAHAGSGSGSYASASASASAHAGHY
ncbi:PREDICTED: fibroin heavy chain-like [Nicrophorus vespilloides]|uniref:Fibroin heavy chain-like n=1 Tax=Nicrophorus vespilloides TaxID=110193 RepID=A0ABM1NCU3_NICVS|nr:PREDICTED: fibroin heavy chain-like [Nicrophorus vespilloides]